MNMRLQFYSVIYYSVFLWVSALQETNTTPPVAYLLQLLLLLGIPISKRLPYMYYKWVINIKPEQASIQNLLKKFRIIHSVLLEKESLSGSAISSTQQKQLLVDIMSCLQDFRNNSFAQKFNYLHGIKQGFVLYDPKSDAEIIVGIFITSTPRRLETASTPTRPSTSTSSP